MGDLTKNFDLSEFACRCGCGFDDIDFGLVMLAQAVREKYGDEVHIRSGCRCETHNRNEGGKPTSDHLTGEGVDIECDNSRLRYLILSSAIRAGFSRIGIYGDFVHVGKRPDNPQGVAW